MPKPASYESPTTLPADEEADFQAWAKHNDVNLRGEDSPTADYDVRGFYKAMKEGRLHTPIDQAMGISDYDNRMHMTDEYKTPYHETFSDESTYAPKLPGSKAVSQGIASPGVGMAPHWMGGRLTDPSTGKTVADEGMQSPETPEEQEYVDAARRAQSLLKPKQ